ncbi:MAG: L-threonylcarbamoyladenylate synthase [Verrucomicrobiota bacterium]|nr:L-threonylcarbamoyladenylate synthase [Verrucomicrobiota bacterium]
MKILDIDNPDMLSSAVTNLNTGGVIIIPTETVYGIACLWNNDAGKQRIFRIKKRPADKKLQILVGSIVMSKQVTDAFRGKALKLAEKFWPGPLTIVVEEASGASYGFRYPDYSLVQDIIHLLGAPLAATSANISGEIPPKNPEDYGNTLGEPVDLLINAGTIKNGVPSTVVSVIDDKVEILREGFISEEKIRNVLRS